MRWVPFFVLIFQVYSFPKSHQKSKLFVATVDLETEKKHAKDPEVVPDIGDQLPPVKRNATLPPDYGDYEDYELTAKGELTTTSPIVISHDKKIIEESVVLDSQFKPHLKISLEKEKTNEEVRDEVSRLMTDLHREELTVRTTVTKEDMKMTTVDPIMTNMSMFFGDEEEGSGEFNEDELLNLTVITTTRKPLLFTTLIQEVKSIPVTARPDPFENVDYDLTNHSNNLKPKTKKKIDRLKKYKLHGGAVDRPRNTTTAHAIEKPKRRKTLLRKLIKVDKMKKVKNLNHRVRAQNRMRLRKVFSKMIFRSRDRTSSSGHKTTKLKFVGSEGVVTPAPFVFSSIDSKTKRSRREKRETRHFPVLEENEPIEMNIIDQIDQEPHSAYHLVQRTQVEPSQYVNELKDDYEDEQDQNFEQPLPVRSGLVQVTLEGNSIRNEFPKRLKMVPLNSVKKVSKRKEMATSDGYALLVPNAKKPTMLELLIGDFLGRLPPMARSQYISQEQWS